jgi:hypothetical protein
MPQFFVDQNSVKTLAKDLGAVLGRSVGHRAILKNICAALGWRDDVLMHRLKQFAEAGRTPVPAIPVPANFSRALALKLSSAYGRDVSSLDVAAQLEGSWPEISENVRPSEALFGTVARKMFDNGWNVFPQEIASRRPGSIDGKIIKWSDFVNSPPEHELLDRWISECSAMNVAVALGPASGGALVIDLDITDMALRKSVQKLAVTHLTETPLRMLGPSGKIMLVYRQYGDDKISSSRHLFSKSSVSNNRDGAHQSVEVLSDGQAITMHGKHHKTGTWLQWLEESPVDVGPETCPAIDRGQLTDFLAAVDAIHRFESGQKSCQSWSVNADGLVHDGRESYLDYLVARELATNDFSKDDTESIRIAAEVIAEKFENTAVASGRWSGQALIHEAMKCIRLPRSK